MYIYTPCILLVSIGYYSSEASPFVSIVLDNSDERDPLVGEETNITRNFILFFTFRDLFNI